MLSVLQVLASKYSTVCINAGTVAHIVRFLVSHLVLWNDLLFVS
jgi:hypothetical protein